MKATSSQAQVFGLQQLEEINNPVTGDRMMILQSSQTSQGTYAKIQFDLPPGAKGSPLHYHTRMSETFTVIKGELKMEVGGKGNWRILKAGERVHVPTGMHTVFITPLVIG